MKKLFFILSVILNILLFILCIYQMSRPPKQIFVDNSYATHYTFQQNMPVKNGDIVFIGGKQILDCDWYEFLDNCKIKNRGLPQNRIGHELVRLEFLLENNPSQLFLLLGIDDLNAGASPAEVFEQYKKLLQLIREKSPMTEIIIQSVLPVNNDLPRSRMRVENENIRELNENLKNYALGNGIVFINLFDDFQDENGNLISTYTAGDGYLLNFWGYQLWKERIESFVRD